jgi:hypothetical protein
MKQLIIIAFAFISFSSFSQSFDGVPISGDLPTAIAKFKVKGYVLDKYVANGVIMKGRVANSPVELFILTTPKSKRVFKMVAFLDEQTSWVSLKSEYYKYKNILTEKYGNSDETYDFFSQPYYEGDGYELSAVGLEKATFAAYWFKRDNLTLGVEISKFKQVKLVYENNQMMEIKNKEQAEVESNSF